MGLGDFFRRLRGDRRAMPDPESAEFEQAVRGSALPGSTEMGERGWASVGSAESAREAPPAAPGISGAVTPESLIAAGVPPESAAATAAALSGLQQAFGGTHTLDLGGMQSLKDQMEATLREHGVDPDSGEALDASSVPGLQEALLRVLGENGVDVSRYDG